MRTARLCGFHRVSSRRHVSLHHYREGSVGSVTATARELRSIPADRARVDVSRETFGCRLRKHHGVHRSIVGDRIVPSSVRSVLVDDPSLLVVGRRRETRQLSGDGRITHAGPTAPFSRFAVDSLDTVTWLTFAEPALVSPSLPIADRGASPSDVGARRLSSAGRRCVMAARRRAWARTIHRRN